MNHQNYEILILGGGVVGLTAALLLAKLGLQVGLVEKNPPAIAKNHEEIDIRCSAITPASEEILRKIGVWEMMPTDRLGPYDHMHVWDALGFGEISFDAALVAKANLGHIVENKILLQALVAKAKEAPTLELIFGVEPLAVSLEEEEVSVLLVDQRKLKANCLIGADGGHSWVRDHLQFESKNKDYQQDAIIATVTTELPHARTAWQRFLPEGSLAFLPLKEENLCSIVWATTKEMAAELKALALPDFCQELAHHFDYRLGKVLTSGERQSYPLRKLTLPHCVKKRVVLIGDAAHVIHPLAGQGVNVGIADAEVLAGVMANAIDRGIDLGNYLILRHYERARKGKVTTLIMALDFLKGLFSQQSSVAIGIRSIGLKGVDKNQWLKKKIILEAMGV